MPRRAASTFAQKLCYDGSMADVASPDVSKKPGRPRKPRMKKHIISTPGTVETISKAVGVTKKDAALVRKVLLELGYIQEEAPAKKRSAASERKGKSKTRKS